MPFEFVPLDIPAVILVKPKVFGDDRGFFMETYKRSDFVAQGIPDTFVQDNYSHSSTGILRGLHYQLDPAAQGKLVGAIRGEIFDVAVDIRRGSPSFGQWVGAYLSDQNHHRLWVPAGFAHGFCVTRGPADVVYKVTSEYSAPHDRGILWSDPSIGIQWPLSDPQLSSKDQQHPTLDQAEISFVFQA